MPEEMEAPVEAPVEEKASDSNLMAALSYLWILSAVMLMIKKDDPYVAFHAKQGLVLFLASIILWFVPFFGWFLQMAVVLGVVVGFVKAMSGERYRMPLVGDLAEKIKI